MARLTLAALVAALCVPVIAAAHVEKVQGSKAVQLQARVAHDRGVIRSVDRQAVRVGSAMFIEYRLWRIRQWHARDLASALQQLVMLQRPAHFSGWVCIHHGEGAWNSNTGNGYYGGLQMTKGWAGLVVYAHQLSPLAQIRAAEEGYRRSGYSHAWLAGQWPNTYPPCAGYF